MCARPNPTLAGLRPSDACGPSAARSARFCDPLRSKSHEHPRIPANTATAAPSIFAAFRWYSRQFADLRNIGANG
jgi:hypothetical protein